MSDKFHTEMEVTKGKVLEMGYLAVGMLDDAMAALEENDPQRAEGVKARKKELSDRANALEEEMYQLIALYQPMAKDMRMIACSLRLISSAERIGRYGKTSQAWCSGHIPTSGLKASSWHSRFPTWHRL